MKALVTGADGFAGRFLVEHLEQSGDEPWRFGRKVQGPRSIRGDISDLDAVRTALSASGAEVVYHLAAVSYGPDVADDVSRSAAVNVLGTINVLSASASVRRPPAVLVVSSSEVYAPKDAGAIDESELTRPRSAYGATKLGQEAVALAYHHAGAVRSVIARPFNHIGPGQRPDFVVPAFATQLARIALGTSRPVVRVGDLSAVRDFTDVRDVVRAYRLMVVGGHFGEPLNIASGVGVRISDLLRDLMEISGVAVSIQVDAARLRGGERATCVIGDSSRLRAITGWRPAVPFRSTLEDVWRDIHARSSSAS